MTPERWQQIEKLFHSALELDPDRRVSFLDQACAADPSLRGEVESLIASNEEAKEGSFLRSPLSLDKAARLSMELIGRVIDDKYRIEKQLGQGGMGAVFLATHIGTGRPVAIKVIAPQFMAREEFVERFKREAKAASLLRLPNVVNVTDFGFASLGSQRLAYLVMEYLNGCTLGVLMQRKRQLPLGFVVDVVEQICLAIGEAHKQGIIHRDLKPDNIWLEPDGRGGYLRRERPDHTIQTTALVHEAYLRLIDQHSVRWQNRAHFFGVAAQMMRRILVNYAVANKAAKRGGKQYRLAFDEALDLPEEMDLEIVALNDALNTLATIDERKSRIVELRYLAASLWKRLLRCSASRSLLPSETGQWPGPG
jgi:serine/threonine protein kinase